MPTSDFLYHLFQSITRGINNFLHLPYIYDLSWYLVWLVYIILAPLHLIPLALMFIYDLLTGAFWTERYLAPNEARTVFITGCDSGFGHDVALDLVGKGWKVYAGCISEEGMKGLMKEAAGQGAENLVPLLLDVTNEKHIQEVVTYVQQDLQNHGQQLFALINNAGIGLGGLIDWVPMDHFRRLLEVNFFGVVAMCKACLPLLKSSAALERHTGGRWAPHPRIINVTSFAGLFPGQPIMSAYCASKHAAESFSRSLRAELECWGVDVAIVNPTFHFTKLVDQATNTIDKAYQAMPVAEQAAYGQDFLQQVKDITSTSTLVCAWDPVNVVKALRHASTAKRPRRQYIIGMDGRFVLFPIMMLPERITDGWAWLLSKRFLLKPAGRDEINAAAAAAAIAAANGLSSPAANQIGNGVRRSSRRKSD